MYCLYVGFDYTYIDINALAQGIKSFSASQIRFQAVVGTRTYGTDSRAVELLRVPTGLYLYSCVKNTPSPYVGSKM